MRIAARNDELNAVCFLDETGARASADEIDAAVARGEDPGPFAGVPDRGEGARAGEGLPEHPRVDGVPRRHRRGRLPRGRAVCAPPAR